MHSNNSLEELQHQIETLKLKLAEAAAKEKLLEEQKTTLLEELTLLGVDGVSLDTIIPKLEAELAQQVSVIRQQLAQLPVEVLEWKW